MRFHGEKRSNGITYLQVFDEDGTAGAFALSTSEWVAFKAAVEETFEVTEDGEPVVPE